MIKIFNGNQVLVDDETGEIIDQVFFKTPNNHDTLAESLRTSTYCEDPSLTDQSFKEEVNINTIMDRVKAGAQLPITLPEHFGDATTIPQYIESVQKIAENNATFYNLAPAIREEFMNDPTRWTVQVMKDLDKGDLNNLKRMGINIDDLQVYTTAKPAAPQEAISSPGAPETPPTAKAAGGATDTPKK